MVILQNVLPNQGVVDEYLVLCKMVITHFSYVFVVLSVLTGVRVTAVINTVTMITSRLLSVVTSLLWFATVTLTRISPVQM